MFFELKSMGFTKEEIKSKKVVRGIKTVFFVIYMLLSFLFFSAPILLVVADALLPSALLSASLSPASVPLQNLSVHFSNYDFRYSLIDIPLISLVRSAVILCVYSLCDGPKLSRGPYLTIATVCSVASLLFVSLKASYVFGNDRWRRENEDGYGGGAMELALFACSVALAIGHVIVAYRTSCRERRKMLVYRIDIEAISAYKIGLPRYQQKLLQEERVKSRQTPIFL